ncbi:MAG: ribokinase [Clostridiales bacterium]|nr:ribokinase [Clostridiales bacterium]MDK2933747.1 ribokinase [Clostridiales bacterium]
MKKSRITVIGSLNMDLVVNVSHMPKVGETIMGRNFITIPGGKGANQAVAAGKLGADVYMIGKVGTDEYGSVLMDNLKSANVDVSGVKQQENMHTGLAFINVDNSGNNNIVVVSGANGTCSKEDIDTYKNIIQESEIIILQLEIPLDTVIYAVNIAKDLNKTVILNPAPAVQLPDRLLKQVDILTPNETELEILTGIEVNSLDDVEKAARVLLGKGVNAIIVTVGEKGAVMINDSEVLHVPVEKVDVADTTAAGDSFTASLAVGLSQGMNYKEAIEFANKVATVVVTREGAQTSLPTLEEVNQFFENR